MTRGKDLNGRSVVLHTGLGASIGAVLATSLLAFDVAGLGSMLLQADQVLAHVVLIFAKPMMVAGMFAAGWSVWR